MPSAIKPLLLHIICDDTDYEQSLFEHIVSTSSLRTIETNLKEGSNNDTGFSISFDVTTYKSYSLHLLGNFQPWQNNSIKQNTYPTITQPIHEHDCEQFFNLGVKDGVINTLWISTNVINWITLEKLLLIKKANIQSVFVHLGATDKLKDLHPRTKAILEFINLRKLPFLQKSPDPNNKDWIKDILDEINTSIVRNQSE